METVKKTRQNKSSILGDLLHLVYPEKCVTCENELTDNEAHICSLCDADLTETSYHLYDEPTAFDKLFWGRVKLAPNFALFSFTKGSALQRLLFQFKYHHTSTIGNVFGARMGKRISTVDKYAAIEVLLPVPLHAKKQFVRGYNQSLALAKGISSTSKIPIDANALKRKHNNATQTKKDRFDRWSNVSSVFWVSDSICKYKHIAIVDDVVTTGSTIEALVQSIRKVHPEVEISVLTLAIA
ncbi:MAG: ComF family protein [Crocinitomicaceae bacterium]